MVIAGVIGQGIPVVQFGTVPFGLHKDGACDWFDPDTGTWQAAQAAGTWHAKQTVAGFSSASAGGSWSDPASNDWFDPREC